jgi:bifunctional non-homologous end joining protein LigD
MSRARATTGTDAIVPGGTQRDRRAATQAVEQLDALRSSDATGTHVVEVAGHPIKLTNVDKVLYPEVGFTKLDVASYYARIAPVLLRHLRGRPLTLKRYPDGVDGEFFYQKRCPDHRPDFIRTTGATKHDVDYCLPDDVATLVWMANLADLELHVLLSTSRDLQRPTALAFDLDPGEGAGITQCCEVALLLRALLAGLDLDCVPKASGSKGIQVYVPLNRPEVTYAHTKPFARAVAQLLERREPELVVSNMRKELRRGKVLIDWSQNDDHKTTVAAYSLRAMARPTASTPLRWSEVEQALADGGADDLRFEHDEVLARVHEHGDLFAPVLELRQRLPESGR